MRPSLSSGCDAPERGESQRPAPSATSPLSVRPSPRRPSHRLRPPPPATAAATPGQNEDEDAELKLIDFGFACELKPGKEAMWDQIGTPSYMAPELWSERQKVTA